MSAQCQRNASRFARGAAGVLSLPGVESTNGACSGAGRMSASTKVTTATRARSQSCGPDSSFGPAVPWGDWQDGQTGDFRWESPSPPSGSWLSPPRSRCSSWEWQHEREEPGAACVNCVAWPPPQDCPMIARAWQQHSDDQRPSRTAIRTRIAGSLIFREIILGLGAVGSGGFRNPGEDLPDKWAVTPVRACGSAGEGC